MLLILVCLFHVPLSWSSSSSPPTPYYVSANGTDTSNTCQDAHHSCRTFKHLFEVLSTHPASSNASVFASGEFQIDSPLSLSFKGPSLSILGDVAFEASIDNFAQAKRAVLRFVQVGSLVVRSPVLLVFQGFDIVLENSFNWEDWIELQKHNRESEFSVKGLAEVGIVDLWVGSASGLSRVLHCSFRDSTIDLHSHSHSPNADPDVFLLRAQRVSQCNFSHVSVLGCGETTIRQVDLIVDVADVEFCRFEDLSGFRSLVSDGQGALGSCQVAESSFSNVLVCGRKDVSTSLISWSSSSSDHVVNRTSFTETGLLEASTDSSMTSLVRVGSGAGIVFLGVEFVSNHGSEYGLYADGGVVQVSGRSRAESNRFGHSALFAGQSSLVHLEEFEAMGNRVGQGVVFVANDEEGAFSSCQVFLDDCVISENFGRGVVLHAEGPKRNYTLPPIVFQAHSSQVTKNSLGVSSLKQAAGIDCQGHLHGSVSIALDGSTQVAHNTLNTTWRSDVLCEREASKSKIEGVLHGVCSFSALSTVSMNDFCGDSRSFYVMSNTQPFSLDGIACDLQRPCSTLGRAFDSAVSFNLSTIGATILVGAGSFDIYDSLTVGTFSVTALSDLPSRRPELRLHTNAVVGMKSVSHVDFGEGGGGEAIIIATNLVDVKFKSVKDLIVHAETIDSCTFEQNENVAITSTSLVKSSLFLDNLISPDQSLFADFWVISNSIFTMNKGLLFELTGELRVGPRNIEASRFVDNEKIARILGSSAELDFWDSTIEGSTKDVLVLLGGELGIHYSNITDSEQPVISASSHEPLPIQITLDHASLRENRALSVSIDGSNCPISLKLEESQISGNEAPAVYLKGRQAKLTMSASSIVDNRCYADLPEICGIQCYEKPTVWLKEDSMVSGNKAGKTTSNILCMDSKYSIEVCKLSYDATSYHIACLEYKSTSEVLAITLSVVGVVVFILFCCTLTTIIVVLCLCMSRFDQMRDLQDDLLEGSAYVNIDEDDEDEDDL